MRRNRDREIADGQDLKLRHEPSRGQIEDACYATEKTANLPAFKWAEFPFTEWFECEKDAKSDPNKSGYFIDCKSIGEGMKAVSISEQAIAYILV